MTRNPSEGFPQAKPPLVLNLDEPGGGVTYIGEVPVGTGDDQPKWRIRQMTDDGTLLTIKWASGDKEFQHIWDDRASLTYS